MEKIMHIVLLEVTKVSISIDEYKVCQLIIVSGSQSTLIHGLGVEKDSHPLLC
jgi:hypothetical protein